MRCAASRTRCLGPAGPSPISDPEASWETGASRTTSVPARPPRHLSPATPIPAPCPCLGRPGRQNHHSQPLPATRFIISPVSYSALTLLCSKMEPLAGNVPYGAHDRGCMEAELVSVERLKCPFYCFRRSPEPRNIPPLTIFLNILILLSTLQILTHLVFINNPKRVGTIIILNLQTRKPRHREYKKISQCCIFSEWWSVGLKQI